MAKIPRDTSLDSTLALLSDGYTFISTRCQRHRSDIFETRLMLRRVVCVLGEDAARVFYDSDRLARKGGAPVSAVKLLQDKGSVQQMSGQAHWRRKHMFMSLMTPASAKQLVNEAANQWRAHIAKWETMDEVVLHYEVQDILCRAVCQWAGIPLDEAEAQQRTREFAAMIDGAGAVGPRNWRGMLLRRDSERWIRDIVERVRARTLEVAEGSAAHAVAWHRDLDGELLDVEVAAVELINLLRPTVAVAWFVTFSALALHQHPECKQKLRAGEDDYLGLFVQEVRRLYPFFPAVGGIVQKEFEWRGHRFAKGTWILLDLYGTNHDARIWQEPGAFRPERFRRWDGSAFNFIPQGGGDYLEAHRCPGEWLTIELMKSAVRLLTTAVRYEVPGQDLRVDLSRIPAIPQSRFIITNLRRME